MSLRRKRLRHGLPRCLDTVSFSSRDLPSERCFSIKAPDNLSKPDIEIAIRLRNAILEPSDGVLSMTAKAEEDSAG
jgi:hypothetical protein